MYRRSRAKLFSMRQTGQGHMVSRGSRRKCWCTCDVLFIHSYRSQPNDGSPKISTPSCPQCVNTLPYMAKGTLQLIKWRMSRRGTYPGLSRWGHCNHKGLHKRGTGESHSEKDVMAEEGVGDRNLETLHCWLWRWRKRPWAKVRRRSLETRTGKEMGSPPELLKGTPWLSLWWKLFWTSGFQNFKIIHLYCFTSLNV